MKRIRIGKKILKERREELILRLRLRYTVETKKLYKKQLFEKNIQKFLNI